MKTNRWNPFLQFLRNEAGDGGEGGGGGGGGEGGDKGGAPSLLGGEGGGSESWYSSLPDDLKSNPYVAQSKDLAGFVKSAVDTKKMVGANTIRLPGKDATPEELSEFYKNLGRPDTHEAYKPSVEVAEGILDDKILGTMQQKMHELGLSEKQGQTLLNEYLTILDSSLSERNTQSEAKMQEGINALKQEWGDKYDNNVKTAQLALRELGNDTIKDKLVETGLANDPAVIKWMAELGKKLLDDEAIGGEAGGRFSGSSEAAAQEIERLKMDNEFQATINDRRAPGHKEAVERWTALHKQAYPSKSEQE